MGTTQEPRPSYKSSGSIEGFPTKSSNGAEVNGITSTNGPIKIFNISIEGAMLQEVQRQETVVVPKGSMLSS